MVTSEFPPVVGGIANHVFELARSLAPRAEVMVVHPVALGAQVEAVDPPGVRVLRPGTVKAQPFYTWQLAHRLRQAMRRFRPDVLHVHGIRPLAASRGLGVPVVFTNHSSGFLARLKAGEARRRRTEALMRHVGLILAPSDELVEAAVTLGFTGPTEMIANGVDIDRFAPGPSDLRARWGIGPDERVLVLARRLVEKNGVIWFARALALMGDTPFRVVVAGDGPERAGMVECLARAGVADRVVFLGSVPNTDMPAIYRACDIAVLPSLAEATSITGLEAMACGLPLVGTRVGGIPTLIDEERTGLLVPPRDPDAMALALRRLLKAPDLSRAMGEAGRRKVVEGFSWPQIAARTLAAYGRVTG